MTKWYMLTLVGKDQSGIVAKVTSALYEGGCNLGEASMARLGGNFTIMMMVSTDKAIKQLSDLLAPVVESLGLHLHLDHIEGKLHQHMSADVVITVSGADRSGIVAHVTGALAEAGLSILDLSSDVAGSEDKPIYIMQIEGHAAEGVEALTSALEIIKAEGVDVNLQEIDTLIG